MLEQGRNHLLEPHRNGAAAGTDRQHVLLQIGNMAGIGTLRREGRHKYTLQAPKTDSVLLKPGKRHITSKIAMQ